MSLIREIAVFLCGYFTLRLCTAQVVMPGPCPEVKPMADFNPERYLGKWYEAEKYFAIFEAGGKCISATYVQKEDGSIGVINRQISVFTGILSEIQGEATVNNSTEKSKLAVRFPSMPVNVAAPYWVVETDYDNYSVIWSCTSLGFINTRFAWILTRERNPQHWVIDEAYSVLDRNNINKAYFMRTDQSDCPKEKN